MGAVYHAVVGEREREVQRGERGERKEGVGVRK